MCIRDSYLAMATLGLGIIINIVVRNEAAWSGGPDGMAVPAMAFGSFEVSGDKPWYWIVASLLCISIWASINIIDSPFGRALRALHGSEVASKVVGVHVVRQLEQEAQASGVRLLDGGTGGINLLLEFDGVRDIILNDATRDGQAAGSVTFLQPRCAGDLPRGLGAHDFGLKDLFAVSALLDQMPTLHLFTISLEEIEPMCLELSPAVAAAVPQVVRDVLALAGKLAAP